MIVWVRCFGRLAGFVGNIHFRGVEVCQSGMTVLQWYLELFCVVLHVREDG